MSTESIPVIDIKQLTTDLTLKTIIEAAKFSWQKVKGFFKDLDAKDSINYGDAYFSYLRNTVDNISQIKTLIYRHVPKFLYLFYEHPNVKYQDQIIDTFDTQNLLNINNKLIITGTGGLGKSLLLKHIFLDTAQYGYYIPILIELRKFNRQGKKDISLYRAIYQVLSDNGFKLEDEYYSYSLNAGGYVILLDGFDEINREKADLVYEQIKNFSSKYNKNYFIVSSRPSERFIGWNDFYEISLCELTKKQSLHLIQKIDFDESIKKPFSKELNDGLFEKYESFASNPLLLTIMLLTFSKHATLPKNLNDFYEQAFLALFDGHDATKDYFVRDIRSHLSYKDFKIIFSYICFKSYFKNDFEFSEASLIHYIQLAKDKFQNTSFALEDFKEDLTLSVCMLVKDGLNYRFIHRSFQEYFAAWYTCKLTDSNQKRLLKAWLSESDLYSSDKYFESLFDLQPDKVNKIILCPGIKKIKSIYDKKGYSIDFLCELFNGISTEKIFASINDTNQFFQLVTLLDRDKYLYNTLLLTCSLNYGYTLSYPEDARNPHKAIVKLLYNADDRLPYHSWSFDDALSITGSELLLDCLKQFDQIFHLCFDIYEKYGTNSTSKNRKVSSIIDEF